MTLSEVGQQNAMRGDGHRRSNGIKLSGRSFADDEHADTHAKRKKFDMIEGRACDRFAREARHAISREMGLRCVRRRVSSRASHPRRHFRVCGSAVADEPRPCRPLRRVPLSNSSQTGSNLPASWNDGLTRSRHPVWFLESPYRRRRTGPLAGHCKRTARPNPGPSSDEHRRRFDPATR